MKDLGIELDDRPGALAEMGEALGRAGVSVEGGGVFVAKREGSLGAMDAGNDERVSCCSWSAGFQACRSAGILPAAFRDARAGTRTRHRSLTRSYDIPYD